MARAREIAAWRKLGLSLGQVDQLLQGGSPCWEPILAAHQANLEGEARQLAHMTETIRAIRADLARAEASTIVKLKQLSTRKSEICCSFDLPWPWGGESFALSHAGPLNYITGPLGSGKTRLARRIAESLPSATYLELERSLDAEMVARGRALDDSALRSRIEQASNQLQKDGAAISAAMTILLIALEAGDAPVLIIDTVEQGLDEPSQKALITFLRRRRPNRLTLFLLTRSKAILDLKIMGADEMIIYCPANHSPPIEVFPFSGTRGYESVETCLACHEVRARTEGLTVIGHKVTGPSRSW